MGGAIEPDEVAALIAACGARVKTAVTAKDLLTASLRKRPGRVILASWAGQRPGPSCAP